MKRLFFFIVLLGLFIQGYADTLTLRAGLNGFPGIVDAAVRSRNFNSGTFGRGYIEAGSSWC